MRCDEARAALSAAADGEPVEVDRAHVDTCASCAAFERGMLDLRAALRFDALDEAPDVTSRVMAALPRSGRRRLSLLPAAAALVAGAVAGSVFVWPTGGSDVAVASIPARIVAAQHEVTSVAADIEVVEHRPDLTRRGTLRYLAAENLELRLGTDLLAVGERAWRVERDGVIAGAVNIEPFAADGPAALDLVLPVEAFSGASPPPSLGERSVDGRAAIGVQVTAAQLAPLLDGLGLRRAVHGSDEADVWLDADHLVPLAVAVRATDGIDRRRWAAARGHDDGPGDVVVEVTMSNVVVNDAASVDGLGQSPSDVGANAVDRGFRDGDPEGPVPAWLPPGMVRGRAGRVGDASVQTWTDGRAWVKVRSTPSWPVGEPVREVTLGDGVGYVADGGGVVVLHGDGNDAVVTGSISPADLRRVAASLGIAGRRVPSFASETSDVRIPGFAPPAARVDGAIVTLVFAGPGERALVLTTRPGDALTPPLDPDAVGVVVRDTTARWSPLRGELEWIEGDRLWSLRSTTVGLAELVQLAAEVDA